jgi:hypothetical protein
MPEIKFTNLVSENSESPNLKNLNKTDDGEKTWQEIYNTNKANRKKVKDEEYLKKYYDENQIDVIKTSRLLKDALPFPLNYLAFYTIGGFNMFFATFLPQFNLVNFVIKQIFGIESFKPVNIFKASSFRKDAEKQYEKDLSQGVERLEKITSLSKEYKYLLKKNQYNSLTQLGINNEKTKTLKEELDLIEKKHQNNPKWRATIATKLGDFPKGEVSEIFSQISAENILKCLKEIKEDLKQNPDLQSKLENMQKTENINDFKIAFNNISEEEKTLLLGLIKVETLESVIKEEIIKNLNGQINTYPERNVMVNALITNPNLREVVIDLPRGPANEYKGNIENLKSQIEKGNRMLCEDIWNSSGRTDNKGNESIVRVANKAGQVDTLIHEVYHASRHNLTENMKRPLYKLEKKMKNTIQKELIKAIKKASGMETPLKCEKRSFWKKNPSMEEKIEEMMKIFGIEKTDENRPEFNEIRDIVRKMITGELPAIYNDGERKVKGTLGLLDDDFAKIINAITCFENLDKHPLGQELKRKTQEFLEREVDGISLKEKMKEANRVIYHPKLFGQYDFKSRDGEMEEVGARIIESIPEMKRVFPNLESTLGKLQNLMEINQACNKQAYVSKLSSNPTKNPQPNFTKEEQEERSMENKQEILEKMMNRQNSGHINNKSMKRG